MAVRNSSSWKLVAAFLVTSSLAAVAINRCRTDPQPALRAPEASDPSSAQAEPAAERGVVETVPRDAVTKDGDGAFEPSAASAEGASARRPPTKQEPDWEHLVEHMPDAALRQLAVSAPRDVPESQRFTVYEVRALTKLQRMGEAQAKAEGYFERWPSGPDIVYLQSLTGAHPRR